MWHEIGERRRLLMSDVPVFPFDLTTFPPGWLALIEASLLYRAALELDGPFLEVGAWVGRSTVTIAKGLQGRAPGRETEFDTVDLGLTSVAEWRRLLRSDPLKMREIEAVLPHIYMPGGSIAALIENLKRHEVLPHVTTILRGNFLTIPLQRSYGFIFCDTLHDEREIGLYAPKLAQLLRPGGWIICDDIIEEARAEVLRDALDLDFYSLTNPLSQYTKFLVGRRKPGPAGG